jgi:hypothetical protein
MIYKYDTGCYLKGENYKGVPSDATDLRAKEKKGKHLLFL